MPPQAPARPLRWSTAWVTGASTGIGRELVVRLAASGVRVAASARSTAKLDEVAASHPNIMSVPLDVTNLADVVSAHARIVAGLGSIDLAILNAGVWDPMSADAFDAGRVAATMDVNFIGIANALQPLIPAMIARANGHIALVASVAGYRGLPKATAYAPSKAAVISLAEVLRLDLERHGINISLINPGFVATPMTAVNEFPMPFLLEVEEATDRIIRGLERQKFEIAFPWQLAGTLKALRILPYWLYFRLARRLVAKS